MIGPKDFTMQKIMSQFQDEEDLNISPQKVNRQRKVSMNSTIEKRGMKKKSIAPTP